MPPVTRIGDKCTGHDACPPRPAISGEPSVTVSGSPVVRVGDTYAVHGCLVHPGHPGALSAGAPHISVSGALLGRIGDIVSCGGAAAQGEPSVTAGNMGGGSGGGGEDTEREAIFSQLTDAKGKLILGLSEIAAAEYGRANERDRKGWGYFRGFISKWLNRKACAIKDKYDNGGQEPAFIDWNWLMQYERFSRSVHSMLEPSYMFSDEAKVKLSSILEKDGAFEGTGKPFDYIHISAMEQRAKSFQGKSMDFYLLETLVPGLSIKPDGLQTAVANTTIFALPAGHTKVDTSGKKHVVVTHVALFIHDGFDFEGNQWLGGWINTEKRKAFDATMIWLWNEDFRKFRESSGYGCDFRIMTTPELAWEGDFTYDVN